MICASAWHDWQRGWKRCGPSPSPLDRLRADMALHREDVAGREMRLVFYMVAIVGISLTIFGFVTA